MADVGQKKVALGVDVGGTWVRLGLVDEDGRILDTVRFPMKRGELAVFGAELLEQIDGFLKNNKVKTSFDGIGIGTKGYVSFAENRLVYGTLYEGCSDYDLCAELSRRYGVRAYIDNDLHAAALAENAWGIGRETRYFVYVNIGTGTAVGIVDNGHLIRGRSNICGEVGNSLFESGFEVEAIERSGYYSLESVVSGKGLNDELVRLAPMYPDTVLKARMQESEPVYSREIFEACRAGDALAEKVVDTALHMMSLFLVNMEIMLNAETYVFGGGVVTDGGWFLARLEERVKGICAKAGVPWDVKMALSGLGAADAALLGAACVYFDNSIA